ncbi:hypothetical protein [Bordetella genomosp. 8]|uniref:hypothetical protein n=1 Tax=Bordetella genomosp. 8 TaxID=1416806 RepID=UPI0012FE156F|nr:hypothetical protein [Bordetella genomosp. 8]
MSRYPALFHKELRALWDANPCPEVRRLLWEIARLHGRLVDAYDLIGRLREQQIDYQASICLMNMRVVLEAEPSVRRELAIRQRDAARREAQPRPVISTVMMPPIEGPPWPYPRQLRTKKRSRR